MLRNQINTLQPLGDKTAIGLSLLCAVHCLALPVAAALLPSMAGLGLEDETFHNWIVVVVIPLSTVTLFLGCRKHRQLGVLGTGMFGLLLLSLTPLLGHELLGEFRERLLTLAGSALIAASHVKNFQLCRQGKACECPD